MLVWPNLIWPKDHPEEARYRCAHCERLLDSYRKPWMLAHGEWRSANPKSKIAGFWINQLYSPWKEWPETAIEGVEARHGGPETWRAFVNTALGELWDDEAETSVDIATLLARREDYGPRLPAGVCLLTAGVDLQVDRAEVELVGWGKGEESWSIEYRVFPGDPSAPELWRALDEYLAAAQGPGDGAAKPLTKRYAIFKTRKGKGNRRNLIFTGDLLRNFQVRTVSENRAKASVSTRKDRIKAWANQQREAWMVFSPKNKALVAEATRRMLEAMKPRLLVERALGGKQR